MSVTANSGKKRGINMTKTNTTGLEKARAVNEKMKAEREAEKKVSVYGVDVGSDVSDFYRLNARVGVENIARDSLPTLKVTEAMSKNFLANEKRATIGNFYHTKLRQEYKELQVSLVSVSRGYYTKPLLDGKKPVFTQIVSGVILDGVTPFIMYVTKTRLSNLWDFGKEIAPLTRSVESPVPMMAMKVNLTTELVKHDQGESHLVGFELVKDAKGNLDLINDIGVLKALKGGVKRMEETIKLIMDSTEISRSTGKFVKDNQDAAMDSLMMEEENEIITPFK